jgi:ABC-type Zn2+ transport system substrate-binding protein/surface adhesin
VHSSPFSAFSAERYKHLLHKENPEDKGHDKNETDAKGHDGKEEHHNTTEASEDHHNTTEAGAQGLGLGEPQNLGMCIWKMRTVCPLAETIHGR